MGVSDSLQTCPETRYNNQNRRMSEAVCIRTMAGLRQCEGPEMRGGTVRAALRRPLGLAHAA